MNLINWIRKSKKVSWSRRIQEGKILKSSNLSKTSTRYKGSSRRFQRCSFHLKRTPYKKVIAFCSIRSTGKFGKKRCHVAPLTRWHVASVLYKHDDVAPLRGWHMVSIQYGPITRWHVAWWHGMLHGMLMWHDDMACWYGMMTWHDDVSCWHGMMMWHDDMACWCGMMTWHDDVAWWHGMMKWHDD